MQITPRTAVTDRTDEYSGARTEQHRRRINGTLFTFIRRTYRDGHVLLAVTTPGDVRHSWWTGR